RSRSYPSNHERASFSLAVPGPLGGGRAFYLLAPQRVTAISCDQLGAGHSVILRPGSNPGNTLRRKVLGHIGRKVLLSYHLRTDQRLRRSRKVLPWRRAA